MGAKSFDELKEYAKKVAEPYSSLKAKAKKANQELRKEPFHSKLPDRLQDSVQVSDGARITFTVLHRFSADKQLSHRPWIAVSMRELCRCRHLRPEKVRSELRELEEAGWIDIKRMGFTQVNQYRLYESSRSDREGKKRLANTAQKIRRDREVQKRLSKSIRNRGS